jgi:hypothetical protein
VKAGAKVIDLCKAGDKLMEEYLAGVYNKAKDGKKVKKGTLNCTTDCPAHLRVTSHDAVMRYYLGLLIDFTT